MLVYYGGEDDVTRMIAKQLIDFCSNSENDLTLIAPRDNGSKALQNFSKLVKLGEACPVVGIYDSDGDCVVSILKRNAPDGWKSAMTAINLAIPEAEGWLLADRFGMAKYLEVELKYIPQKPIAKEELADAIPYKVSLFLLKEIAPHSKNKRIQQNLYCERDRKPSTYNSIMIPFIQNHWNIEAAMQNSESLKSAVNRITKVFKNIE